MSACLSDIVRFRALATPDAEAVCDLAEKKTYSWSDLDRRARCMAGFFLSVLRLKKGDRIGFMCSNGITMLDAFFASTMLGTVMDVFNYKLIACELTAMARREKPSVLFFSSDVQDKAYAMRDAIDDDCALVRIDGFAQTGEWSIADVEGCAPASYGDFAPVGGDDLLMLIHTGGSTGCPKAAMLSHKCVFMNAMSQILTWGIDSGWAAYSCMPMFHTTGWNILLLPTLFAGGRVTIAPELVPDDFFDFAQEGRITVFSCADVMLRQLAAHSRFETADFSKIKFVVCGGDPVSQKSLDAFWGKGVRIFSGWGMSEVGPHCIVPLPSTSLEENMRKPFSIGRPMLFSEVRIVDTKGCDVPAGCTGELWIRGESLFLGYWDAPQETRAAFCDGWFKTGDLAFVDDEGDFTICGRKKNMFISGGENIYPVEVERILAKCPGVREVCVFGVPDERWGEVGKAVVVVSDSACTEKQIAEWARCHLSSIKRPKYYQMVSDIPMNAAGKRDLAAVRERWGFTL